MLTGRLSPYLQKPTDGAPDNLLKLAYPLAFWDEVRTRAKAQRVDPLLLLAIMRRESRFDPEAVSAAGAMGLFQIMSYTAEELAPEAGVEATDEGTVLRPAANAGIAAALVRKLSGIFGGAPVPIIAAFNAGEDRVQVWWDAAKGLDEALFVETIPYAETRAYVKEVYVNYLMYKRLYGQ
jgi:soluble lytic murein transglycosylase